MVYYIINYKIYLYSIYNKRSQTSHGLRTSTNMYQISCRQSIGYTLYVDDFVHASQVRFQMHSLPEELITKRATKLGRNIIATHYMTLQMVFEFECTGAVLASKLWLYSTLVFQMAG